MARLRSSRASRVKGQRAQWRVQSASVYMLANPRLTSYMGQCSLTAGAQCSDPAFLGPLSVRCLFVWCTALFALGCIQTFSVLCDCRFRAVN